MIYFLSFYHAFHIFWPNFWVLFYFILNVWGFSKLMKFSWNFWDGCCFNEFKTSCITSHLHYNYIFMHFRCVLYMLNCLCAVRFGLGWAYDVLKFACHMFMHTYLQVSIFVILYLVGAFLIVFLFLSYISCIMAPKRKSTPSWNPLRSGASFSSSPSNPTPSHVRFRDGKAKSDFLENFLQRGIHSKRQVVLLDFSDTNWPIVIYSRGWESLCGAPVTCPSVIIQEFYSNMHRFDYSIPQFHLCSRYMHGSYSGYCIRGTTCS